MNPDTPYIIGIDLGTTNSALSYVDLREEGEKRARIRIFQVPQLTGPGEFGRLPVLPSFLYIPGQYDISKKDIHIPWRSEDDNFVGAFARDHGARVPARLVASAKSWLCHAKADRKARILPWGAGDEVYKVSPVQATAAYLRHLKNSWNSTQGDDPDLYLENQAVVVTVPASFDQVARDLTLEAAQMAGLQSVTLLEEPLAAFYSWLIAHEKDWHAHLGTDELILVCDVGGGTTDFTLITLQESEGSPRFERIAVGDHLLLGGDNIDLALARQAESQFSQKKRASLSGDRWKSLCHQCRQAKEAILDGQMEKKKITLMGKGSKLISATLSAELDRRTVESTVLEGFFPLTGPLEAPRRSERKGISEFGLPYEPDPAITRHLGRFLERHQADVARFLNRTDYAPDLILFNGGSLKSQMVQERIREGIRHWFSRSDPDLPRVLENPRPDLAVALGAAYYGLVKIGEGVRVGSGSPRAYYLGVAAPDTGADRKQAICLVERGLDEGSRIALEDREFEVLANQPVGFDLYSSSFRAGDRCGEIVPVDETLTELPPIRTVVQYGKKGVQTRIPVSIEAEYTEVGSLSLWCRSHVSDHRWQLEFQLRDSDTGSVPQAAAVEAAVIETAQAAIEQAFSPSAEKGVLDGLPKRIAEIADGPRDEWPLPLIRKMADTLIALAKARKTQHRFESRWLNLTGFCMRPGFGDGFDEHRIKQLWKLYKPGPVYPNNAQVRAEWWIFWRRLAGGLKAGQQRQIIQDLSPIMLSKKGGKAKISPQERLEIWMAVANLELLLDKDKRKWGEQLLWELSPKKAKPQELWALSRLGAREPLYGPVDRVVSPEAVAIWLRKLMAQDWRNPKPVINALVQMARKTGDRTRDLGEDPLGEVLDWLRAQGADEKQLHPLQEVVPLQKGEQKAIYGESLPSGLLLRR